jgi:hypothetical protein
VPQARKFQDLREVLAAAPDPALESLSGRTDPALSRQPGNLFLPQPVAAL